ncbi:hypothetical protein [Streptomyces sp. PTD5-9]|uniref:hypothetical protein n=1 Tax=Streptomyces sp. PTD5-9 TaxID=3120150 RepID=UPI003009AA7F
MQIHRSRHACGFTVLPNALLQDRRLSYTARGLLADLLSRPDGWSEDGRRMADTSPQGRIAVAKALRELTAFGYYRVHKVRRPDGTFVSEVHVYDTPQAAPGPGAKCQVVPGAGCPGPGGPTAGDPGANPVKDRRETPSLPAGRRRASAVGTADAATCTDRTGEAAKPPTGSETSQASGAPRAPGLPAASETPAGRDLGGAVPSADGAQGAAAAVLLRAVGAEPRLRLGVVEALALAPLVSAWLERGYGERDLAGALLGGLPARIHSVSALLGDRLTRKLPPALEPPRSGRSGPAVAHWAECGECGRPTPHEGVCRACAVPADAPRPDDGTAFRTRTAARGRALVRAALRTAGRAELPAADAA